MKVQWFKVRSKTN